MSAIGHLLNPRHESNILADEIASILGAALTTEQGRGCRAGHPRHPAFVTGPLRNGEMRLAPVVGGGAPTYARSTVDLQWDEQHLAFAEVAINVPAIHGCRVVHNLTREVSEWSVGANVTDAELLADGSGYAWTITGTGGADTIAAFAYNSIACGDRLFSWRAQFRAANAASVGRTIQVEVRNHTGGTADGDWGSGITLSDRWQTFTSVSRFDVPGNTAATGCKLTPRSDIYNDPHDAGAPLKLAMRHVQVVDITAQIPYWCDVAGLAAADWGQLRNHPIPPPEWIGRYSVLATATPGYRHYWHTRDHANVRLERVAYTPAQTFQAQAWRLISERSSREPIHPAQDIDGHLAFVPMQVADRSTEYARGAHRQPDGLRPYGATIDQRGVYLECITGGTSHATETINGEWALAGNPIGQTIEDGSVVWRVAGRYCHHGAPHYVAQNARTNLVHSANDFDTAGWTAFGTPAFSDGFRADGRLGTDCVLTDASAASDGVRRTKASQAAGTYSFSALVPKSAQGSDDLPGIQLFADGFTTHQLVVLNRETGEIFAEISGRDDGAGYVECWGRFWRVIAVCVHTSGDVNADLLPAASLTGAASDATAEGATLFSLAQLELGKYPSSPIASLAADTTRAASRLQHAATYFADLDALEGIGRFVATQLGENPDAFAVHAALLPYEAQTQPNVRWIGVGQGYLWQQLDSVNAHSADVTWRGRERGVGAAGGSAVNGQHQSVPVGFHFSEDDEVRGIALPGSSAAEKTSYTGPFYFANNKLAVGYTPSSDARYWEGAIGSIMLWPTSYTGASSAVREAQAEADVEFPA